MAFFKDKDKLRCSFCGKDQGHVQKLIAGPSVFICDECVNLCVHILQDDARLEAVAAEAPMPLPHGKEPTTNH